MIADPVHVYVHTPLRDLMQIYRQHPYVGFPVLDEGKRLQGVVKRSAIMEASSKQDRNTFLKIAGIIGGEELRSMPMLQRSFRRISWLGPNIVLNMIAASVIALYQDTLQAVIALAVFLPIISDMSGCSGNQAVAVSIRELTLGLIKPTEYLRIFFKEGGLGLINGSVLGILLGTAAFLWKGNLYLGLVVGSALALNSLLSVLIGGSVPLVLRRMRVDPALASGPILTTVTDMCGFFFVLSFASAVLTRL
jgi:magnesium transporter